MDNKTLGTGLLISLGLAMLTVIFEYSLHPETANMLYAFSGLGMMFFGIWGGIRLFKSDK